MMDTQLLLNNFFDRGRRYFGHKEIISRTSESTIHRFTIAEYAKRTIKLASALEKLGMKKGMKVGTLCWNHHRHLEVYFAVPCSGAILHMLNIRLVPEHLIHIINHAEDEILFIDTDIMPLLEAIKDQLHTVKKFIVMGDDVQLSSYEMDNLYSYEELLETGDDDYEFPTDLNEQMPAAMCYTSATTGLPKGVVYTHRSLVLHSIVMGLKDTQSLSEEDRVMSVVPMFHVSGWGLPFAAINFGMTQILPGPRFTPEILLDLIDNEKVTVASGVPTIWLGVLQALEKDEKRWDLSSLQKMIGGGAASPKGLIRAFVEKYNISYVVGYGLTETSPLVSNSNFMSMMHDWDDERKIDIRSTAGLPVPLVETSVRNEDGEVPWDDKTMREILIRLQWVAAEYYKDERTNESFKDGWFYSGDIGVVTPEGYIRLTDRKKDLIKSGGEWISSVDLENSLMTHDAVFEAAVIAMPHEKWQERPLACVVLKDKNVNEEEIRQALFAYLEKNFVKWWVPDKIVFLDEIPKTTVGKFLKTKLRDDLENLLQ